MDANLREWDFLGKVPCVPEGQGTVAGDEGVAPGEEALSEGLDGGWRIEARGKFNDRSGDAE